MHDDPEIQDADGPENTDALGPFTHVFFRDGSWLDMPDAVLMTYREAKEHPEIGSMPAAYKIVPKGHVGPRGFLLPANFKRSQLVEVLKMISRHEWLPS